LIIPFAGIGFCTSNLTDRVEPVAPICWLLEERVASTLGIVSGVMLLKTMFSAIALVFPVLVTSVALIVDIGLIDGVSMNFFISNENAVGEPLTVNVTTTVFSYMLHVATVIPAVFYITMNIN